jgi:hypothetical protein
VCAAAANLTVLPAKAALFWASLRNMVRDLVPILLLGLLAAGAISVLVAKEQIEESMGGGTWAYVAAVVAGLHFGKSKRELEETITEEVNKRIDSLHRPLGWRPPAFAAPLAGQYCLRCRCKMWLYQTGFASGILNAFENASRYITVRCSQ